MTHDTQLDDVLRGLAQHVGDQEILGRYVRAFPEYTSEILEFWDDSMFIRSEAYSDLDLSKLAERIRKLEARSLAERRRYWWSVVVMALCVVSLGAALIWRGSWGA